MQLILHVHDLRVVIEQGPADRGVSAIDAQLRKGGGIERCVGEVDRGAAGGEPSLHSVAGGPWPIRVAAVRAGVPSRTDGGVFERQIRDGGRRTARFIEIVGAPTVRVRIEEIETEAKPVPDHGHVGIEFGAVKIP